MIANVSIVSVACIFGVAVAVYGCGVVICSVDCVVVTVTIANIT